MDVEERIAHVFSYFVDQLLFSLHYLLFKLGAPGMTFWVSWVAQSIVADLKHLLVPRKHT